MRGGEPFPGEPGLSWWIYGEKGEIRITNPMALHDMVHAGVEIKLHEFKNKEAQKVEVPEDEMSDLEHPSQNVGRIYMAYAEGRQGGEGGYADWKKGMERHDVITEMWKRSDGGKAFGEPVGTAGG